jgi:YHS domain-containing protein
MSVSDESTTVKDPVCGKEVDTLRARAVGIFGGVTYYFCSAECKAKYQDPRKTPREPTVPGKLAHAERDRGEEKREKEREKQREKQRKREAAEAEAEPSPQTAAVGGHPDELDESPKSNSGAGAWIVVIMLFAVAGAVLFFALR